MLVQSYQMLFFQKNNNDVRQLIRQLQLQRKHYKIINKMDFSNIFSPKSQRILAKRKGLLSPQHSPIKLKVHRESLINVPVIQEFRKLTKIRHSDINVQNILQTIKMENIADRQIDLRVKTNKLFLQYTHNPLVSVDVAGSNAKQQDSIFTAIENLNKRDPSASMKDRIAPLKSQINDLCMHLKKRIQKTMRMAKHKSMQKMIVFKHPDVVAKAPSKNPFEQLDDIINLKDDYFFSKYYAAKQLDIFQLINENRHRKFKSNREILDDYYFCNDSIWLPTTLAEKKASNKFYFNHLECISSFSRVIARGVIPQKLPDKMLLGEGDIALNLDGLNFYDIMVVASNRLTSRTLFDYFEEIKKNLQKKINDRANNQQINAPSIIYGLNTRNRCINFDPVDQDKTEIEYFHKSPFTNIEQRQDQLSKSYHAKLKKTIQEERIAISNTVKDKRLLSKFLKRKEKTLLQHLQGDVDKRLALLMKQVQRKIRINKINKNRTEKIKIESLAQSFRVKRALEVSPKSSKGKQNNSFSPVKPLKTWRG